MRKKLTDVKLLNSRNKDGILTASCLCGEGFLVTDNNAENALNGAGAVGSCSRFRTVLEAMVQDNSSNPPTYKLSWRHTNTI